MNNDKTIQNSDVNVKGVGGVLAGSQSSSGAPNEHFDIISVMYHALQGADACGKYEQDARASGDEELANFFERVCGELREQGNMAVQFLIKRAATVGRGQDVDSGVH